MFGDFLKKIAKNALKQLTYILGVYIISLLLLNFMFTIVKEAQMLLGDKIKQLRLQTSLTQEELADRCELTKGYISQLENNLTSPSIATLIDILDILGSNLKEFFTQYIINIMIYSFIIATIG